MVFLEAQMNISNEFFRFLELVDSSNWKRVDVNVGFRLKKIAFSSILRSLAQFWDFWLVFIVCSMVFLKAQMNMTNAFFRFLKLVDFSNLKRVDLNVGFGLKIAFSSILRRRAQFWDFWLVFFIRTMVFLEAQMNISNSLFRFLKLVNFSNWKRVDLMLV